jgi:hypothetical protein
VAELPRSGEQWGEQVTLKRSSGDVLESGGDLTDSHFSGSVQAPESGEHFGIEVSGNMELVTEKSILHCGRHR